jgi:glycosyltransferase involved in cell wall biosynthesis/O-antigen/teichoic acid export membrane protein
MQEGRHILVLTDRDWTHPQGGGTGTNLYGQVSRWVAWGHRVTVVAGDYPGAVAREELGPDLTVHRMGTRLTVFPRAAWACLRRGLARDADVVLEVVNGITFLTPLWLRRPRVALVHHIHRDHYVAEMGRPGAVAALLAETLPLRLLYRDTTFLTISEAGRHDLTELGLPEDRIHVAYLGVEPPPFPATERSQAPRLLYLGRLKQYKRVEVLLDVLEAVPEAVLDIAGDGDHRQALEAGIAARGLGDRVVLHGHVSEEEKAALLSRSWVNLTASSAEGWCLTVMEAAMYRTPSAALAVGGLPESIEDGRTGLLADDGAELIEHVRELVADRALRERLGETALDRASGFTWERTARENLAVLEAEADAERAGLRASMRGSETLKAAGLAAATLASNAIALLFTVLFARLLGADGYGSLAALISTFLILAVPGSALQVVVAREVATGTLGSGTRLASTLAAWRRALLLAFVAVAACSVLLREQMAALLSVEQSWAAAATLPTGCLWLLLSIERGALQGVHAYREVGWSIVLESGGRLISCLLLVAAGLGVTGAYLGTPISMAVTAVVLVVIARRRIGVADGALAATKLRELVSGAWPAVIGLFLVAVLQNVDVILVKRTIGGDAAGAYAAAAVAAKAVVWVAIGVGLYLLPEATRRAGAGEDPRPVLLRALGVVAAVAVPMLIVYAVAPSLVLRLAFGEETVQAAGALLVLGFAMTLLAAGYLCVQYMLALREMRFLIALGVAAAAEIVVLSGTGLSSIVGFATVVLALQAVAALTVLALGLARRPDRTAAAAA